MTASPRPSSNRPGSFLASGFPRVLRPEKHFKHKKWKGLELDLRPEGRRGTPIHKNYEGD